MLSPVDSVFIYIKKFAIAIVALLMGFDAFAQSGKILIVATNRDSVGSNRSGTYLMEIAYPFQVFTQHGYEVDILTPKGGKTAIYDNGRVAEDLAVIAKTDLFTQKTGNSLSPDQIDTKKYVAVFYPGGHGQFFDVVDDERIAKITAQIYENRGVLGTAGHGVASLINVRLKNGDYLVKGKTITCFPSWAEKKYMNISHYGRLLAFDMQEVLARRGANLIVCTDEATRANPANTNIIDQKNRIITGAFATAAGWVAEEMIKMLDKKR